MKRIQTILILSGLVFGLAVPTWAIDAKPKSGAKAAVAPADTSNAGSRTNESTPTNAKLLEKLKQDVRESRKSNSNQYDNYIDSNNDGIDDRMQQKTKAKETETTEKVTAPQVKKVEPPKRTVTPQTKRPEKPRQDTSINSVKKKRTP